MHPCHRSAEVLGGRDHTTVMYAIQKIATKWKQKPISANGSSTSNNNYTVRRPSSDKKSPGVFAGAVDLNLLINRQA